jgi:hypothetical protein
MRPHSHYPSPNILRSKLLRRQLEKATEAAVIDRKRFQTILIWAIIAGVLAAIAAWIAAWPVIKEWIR